MSAAQIESMAHAAHEANRAWCLSHGDASQPSWDDAPEWQVLSTYSAVRGVLAGNSPEQSHEQWIRERTAAGWVYGEVKDVDTKRHPCLVPYADLPPEQRAKDALFIGVARAMLAAWSAP